VHHVCGDVVKKRKWVYQAIADLEIIEGMRELSLLK